MSDRIIFNHGDFASAYIQTLPHARKEEEFESREDFLQYLDKRQENYFSHFMTAVIYAYEETQSMSSDDLEDK